MFGQKWRFEDIRILVGVTFLSAHTLPGRRLGSVEQTADICTWQILLGYSVNIPVYLTQLWNIFAKGEKSFLFRKPEKKYQLWWKYIRLLIPQVIPRELCGIPNGIRLFRKVNLQQCDSFSSSNQRQMKSWHIFIWRSRTLLMLLRQIVQIKYLWLCWTLMVDK